jgi:glycosyltransferase involved in cell wall biosynthesis
VSILMAGMLVTHYQRRSGRYAHSIERVFAPVRASFPPEWKCHLAVCRYPSSGFFRRLWNTVESIFYQGDVNHITGDINYLSCFLSRARTVLTIHDCGAMLRLRRWRRLLFRWFWLVLPVRRCAVVTVISKQTKEELLSYTGCADDKVRIVPNPVGSEFVPSPKLFDTANPVILQVGTAANKNLCRVAKALCGLVCRFHIVGPLRGQDRSLLEQLRIEYRSSERLTDEQMVRAYADADIIVFASTYEGFGMPIVEAQAVGRVVVASAIPPMCDVAGGAACLADPFNVMSIRSAILKVIHDGDYRESLISSGYENVKRFRPSAIAQKYIEIYEELSRRAR